MAEYIERKSPLIDTEEQILNRGEKEIIKEIRNLDMTTNQVMLGITPSIQYTWHTKNGDIVAEFKIWDWWDGKNVSDLEISKKYRGLGLSYQLLDYATKKCGARNLAVEKSNTIAKHVYDKYGFQITDEDDKYYYMSLSKEIIDTWNRRNDNG